MRDIKFRAWFQDAKALEEVSLPWAIDGYGTGLIDIRNPQKRINAVLMQYTGLKDKNRNEIYEGDFLSASHPDESAFFCGYIIYDTEQAAFMLRTEICADIYLYEFDEFKSIGNIYENPELGDK